MELTEEQRQELAENGFVRIPGVIPKEKVDAALRAINGSIGEKGIPPEDLPTLRARSYCPELQGEPVITGLFEDTPFRGLAESAIGAGKVGPIRGGQIALRFPAPGPAHEPHAHIDGMYTPTNGVPKGTIANFTALAGVVLSDVDGPSWGNLTVWPGSHLLHAEWFRERGPQSLLEGMPQVELPAPVQLTGRAGDVVLAHYLLAHGVAGNSGPHIRYGIYFRLNHVDHERTKWESMVDPWLEWEGMAAHRSA